MTRLPETAHDSGDDWRWLREPVPSLPEELASYTPPTIARGIPDATAWDEDEARIVLPAHTLRLVRDMLAGRYLTSEYHAQAIALVVANGRRAESGLPPMTHEERVRCCAAAAEVYREQRAEYLADWPPTIPESERAA